MNIIKKAGRYFSFFLGTFCVVFSLWYTAISLSDKMTITCLLLLLLGIILDFFNKLIRCYAEVKGERIIILSSAIASIIIAILILILAYLRYIKGWEILSFFPSKLY